MQRSALWPEADLNAASAPFEEVVQPHVPRLLGIARRFLRSEDLAWDAVQETLITLWKQRALPTSLGPWLDRTVVNRCLHSRRSCVRRESHETRAANWRSDRLAQEARDFVPADPDEPTVMDRVRAALDAMPDETQRAFWLRELHGLDYASIARRLGVPLGTVRSRIHRARFACRASFAPGSGALALTA